MQAVGEVDLQLAFLHTIHFRRTEPGARRTKLRSAFCALGAIQYLQVARLILFMDRTAHEYIRKAIRHGRCLHVRWNRRLTASLAVQSAQSSGIAL